jgi:hypothetical protein
MRLNVRLDARGLMRWLVTVASLLVFLHVLTFLYRYAYGLSFASDRYSIFWLDGENNVPAWFSSITLAMSSLLLAAISTSTPSGTAENRRWVFLSIVFALMSLDETASLHERLSQPVAALTGASGLFYFAWVIPALCGLTFLGSAYVTWYLALPHHVRRIIGAAAAVYVTGAVGLEMVAGEIVSRAGIHSAAFALSATIEEALEMAGAILFVYGFARHAENQPPLRTTVASPLEPAFSLKSSVLDR